MSSESLPMETHLYHLYTLTALHVGSGQGSGVIDLPITREKSTGLPVVPGSAIKGVLREELRPDALPEETWRALFGPETTAGQDLHAGALAVGDARLLCLAVRSLRGTFAYATCPLVLRRYARDLGAGHPAIPTLVAETAAEAATETEALTTDSVLVDGGNVYLEDLDMNARVAPEADAWADAIAPRIFPNDPDWQTLFRERFLILTDENFDFLAETATEVRARVRLKEGTRTVAKGALWYEENLPAESVLWGVVACDRSFRNNVELSASQLLALLPADRELQIGGKATVGRGRCRWLLG